MNPFIKTDIEHTVERVDLILSLCAVLYKPFLEVSEAVSELNDGQIRLLYEIACFGNNQAFISALERLEKIPRHDNKESA